MITVFDLFSLQPMQLFYAPLLQQTLTLPEDESRHCIKVLRHINGDKVLVTDGMGKFYECEIITAHPAACKVKILETRIEKDKGYRLELAVAPTKNGERTDWMIEKLVEMGIDTITFLSCRNNERDKINLERCERIAVSAMKQSMKATLPVIRGLVSMDKLVKNSTSGIKIIAHCYPEINRIPLASAVENSSDILCCIGPEGDFTREEIALAEQHDFKPIHLGDSRLRTETAAIVACSFLYIKTSL